MCASVCACVLMFHARVECTQWHAGVLIRTQAGVAMGSRCVHGQQKQFDFGQTKLWVVSVGYLPLWPVLQGPGHAPGNTSTAVLWLLKFCYMLSLYLILGELPVCLLLGIYQCVLLLCVHVYNLLSWDVTDCWCYMNCWLANEHNVVFLRGIELCH